jgi:hypothetical protein
VRSEKQAGVSGVISSLTVGQRKFRVVWGMKHTLWPR